MALLYFLVSNVPASSIDLWEWVPARHVGDAPSPRYGPAHYITQQNGLFQSDTVRQQHIVGVGGSLKSAFDRIGGEGSY